MVVQESYKTLHKFTFISGFRGVGCCCLSASIYRDYLNELMSYQKIHKLSDIDNIHTYRLSITAGVSGAGCVRLIAVVAVFVS